MNVVENTEGLENMNVLPLFDSIMITPPDLLEEFNRGLLNQEILEEEPTQVPAQRLLVSETQFPDHAMVVLNKQLNSLENSLARLRFYLSDLDDLLPR